MPFQTFVTLALFQNTKEDIVQTTFWMDPTDFLCMDKNTQNLLLFFQKKVSHMSVTDVG